MNKLTKKEKFCYGLGDLSSNIVLAAINFYLLYFFVKVAGLNTTWAGLIFIIARVWDAISDYLMGRISDSTHSKWGKRRVYMIFGSLPYGLIFVLLWLVPFGPETAQFFKFLYYTGAYLLFNTVWTIVYIPYNSLTANITDDYDERTSLNGVRIIMANIGILLGAAFFALFADGNTSVFYQLFQSEAQAYLAASALFGLIAFVVMFISGLNIKEHIVSDTKDNHYGFFETLKQFWQLKEFRNITLFYLLSMVGFDIIMSIFVFYVNDTLGFAGGSEAMIFIAIPLVCAILAAPFWVKLSQKYNKSKVYTIGAIYLAVVLLLVLLLRPQQYFDLITFTILAGIGMACVQILPWACLPDVIEIDEYTNHVRRDGAYYGIVQFLYKVASGVGVATVSFILGLFGYQEAIGSEIINQPTSALLAIRVVFAILPGLIFLLSSFFARRGNIDREHFNDIKIELAKRHQVKKG